MDKRFLVALPVLLSACNLSPDFTLPSFDLPAAFKEQPEAPSAPELQAMPEGQWKDAEPADDTPRGEWWRIFNDENLNALITQATQENTSLAESVARVNQARARAGIAFGALFPNVNAGFAPRREALSGAGQEAFTGANAGPIHRTLYGAQAAASWEVSLFGALTGEWRASQFDAEAREHAHISTLLAVQAEVARQYFTLRALDAERDILRRTVEIRSESERLIARRAEAGEESDLAPSRATAELATARAELLAVERARASAEHAMAVLLGQLPSAYSFAESPLADTAPPAIPAGLPSRLLERRPDIASAERSLAAANRRIGVARAAMFPSLVLNATGGFESTELSDLFQWSSRAWTLGPLALSQPIFEGGRAFANVDRIKAQYEEQVAAYRGQVLNAFREVEDALAAQRLLEGESAERNLAAEAAERGASLARKRYEVGESAYLESIDAERAALEAKRAAVRARADRLGATIDLIRALGGGWDAATLAEPNPELLTPLVD